MDETKKCNRCGFTRPVADFYKKSNGRVNPWCKSCYREWYAERSGGYVERACDNCGTVQRVTARRAAEPVYCSRDCKDRARKDALIAGRRAAKPAERECLHCAKVFGPEVRADAIFCSQKCNYSAHALQRKLRARTGQDNKPGYLRAEICKRDKWRCGICGDRVNPALEHPHPRAASLDHVVPVCEGGLSEPANLRLVHLVCNLRRRHLGGGEQLSIV